MLCNLEENLEQNNHKPRPHRKTPLQWAKKAKTPSPLSQFLTGIYSTAQKMKFSIKDFLSKCDQILSHSPNKEQSVMHSSRAKKFTNPTCMGVFFVALCRAFISSHSLNISNSSKYSSLKTETVRFVLLRAQEMEKNLICRELMHMPHTNFEILYALSFLLQSNNWKYCCQ